MDDMWILARARELEDEAHRRSIIIQRRAAMAIVGEAA
jgi:hypothetical protein